MGRAERVGLFGGSFDPVHNAHLALARAALDACELDRIRWIPAGQAWQKERELSPAVHREAMVKLAIEGEPRFAIDRCEIERTGPSYTLDTVRTLAAQHPSTEWVLIIGHDQYAGLHTWQGWRELLARVTLGVANRPGPAREVAAEVRAHPQRVVPLPMLDISSTAIRDRVAAGLSIASLVPPPVARYIESHHLYRDLATSESTPQGS